MVFALALAAATMVVPPGALAATVYLDALDLATIHQGWGEPRAKRSVGDHPLTIAKQVYPRGIGTHAESEWWIDLNGLAVSFTALVGVDDEANWEGSVVFEVVMDGRTAWSSGLMKTGMAASAVIVDLTGVKRLGLLVTDGGNGIDNDHADWANALLKYSGAGHPTSARPAAEPPPPIVHPVDAAPRINHPRVTGATPGRPFLFRIPASGEPPITYTAAGMPEGLALDPASGVITGSLRRKGEWSLTVTASNIHGRATTPLRIVGGSHRLALTPPMGWNSWNAWGCAVDQQKILAAAHALVDSGLAAHGFQYINIDDCWEGARGPDGVIRTNEKFPDMKALSDEVHRLGLKLGIYSSPGPKTCGGYPASFGHEEQDARTWARWGVDYVKYDWCSYGDVVAGSGTAYCAAPYAVMRSALDAVDRDIVFSFCQYGMEDVWKWGAAVGGNLWRTTGDITDTWTSLSGITFRQPEIASFSGPGHWNDPDMLVVGQVGWGPKLHPSRLTPHEQVTHLTAWAMLAAPLLIGCDLTRLDPFTLALLTNDEVLAVDQDELGKAATRRSRIGRTEVWARPLADGTTAVGLFNTGFDRADVTATWRDCGVDGPHPVRDLWEHHDLGTMNGRLTMTVPAHGARLLRIGRSLPPGR